MESDLVGTPKVSVVMATYNAAAYLPQAVESVLNQTMSDFEFIIVDDGSTDSSMSILDHYHDNRLVFLRNPRNLGQTVSLNRALREAVAGEFVARVDADDIAEPDMLNLMTGHLDAHPEVGVVGSAKLFVNGEGTLIRTWMPPLDNAAIQRTLLVWSCIPHGGAMFRTVALVEAGGYSQELRYAQDYDLALRVTEQWDAVNLPQPLYRYRWHDAMVSIDKREKQDGYARQAVAAAVRRRLALGRAAVGFGRTTATAWVKAKPRPWLAQRFVWWSAAAREVNRRVALEFLVVALILDPGSRLAREYLSGISQRKLGRLGRLGKLAIRSDDALHPL